MYHPVNTAMQLEKPSLSVLVNTKTTIYLVFTVYLGWAVLHILSYMRTKLSDGLKAGA